MHSQKFLKLILKEWKQNYRFHGGLAAFAYCWQGTRNLENGKIAPPALAGEKTNLDVLTFSVVPPLTFLWSQAIQVSLNRSFSRILLGDCSGGLYPVRNQLKNSYPLINFHHGKKLDLFITKVCIGDYVLICDDDVFFLNDEPLQWGLTQMNQDPSVMVVSFMPREGPVVGPLAGVVEEIMGSYCLLVRRSLWLQENLSFDVVASGQQDSHGWFYDTGDYAQLQILKRGYKVCIAPEFVQKNLVTFEGVSSWTMRIQASSGNILQQLKADKLVRPAKALRAIYILREIENLTPGFFPDASAALPKIKFLDLAEKCCLEFVSFDEASHIKSDVSDKLSQVFSMFHHKELETR